MPLYYKIKIWGDVKIGYSHYWYIKTLERDLFALWASDCKEIIKKSDISVKGWNGRGKPKTNLEVVSFNGDDKLSESAESFVITQKVENVLEDEGEYEGDFCKTNRKPYDKVVTACLVAAKYRFKSEIRIRSDGDFEEWQEGIELAESVLGKLDLTAERLFYK